MHDSSIQVWGGGIFYPTAFYDACDEFGVLVYHDMQYASSGAVTQAHTCARSCSFFFPGPPFFFFFFFSLGFWASASLLPGIRKHRERGGLERRRKHRERGVGAAAEGPVYDLWCTV